MLFSKPTRYGAGIVLCGDYYDLRSLYDTIHELSQTPPLTSEMIDFVLGLAYDIRHAYQGDRELCDMEECKWGPIKYAGAMILWPYFLFQLAMLRWSLAFQPSQKLHHANVLLLEHCAKESLNTFDSKVGQNCFEQVNLLQSLPTDYLFGFVDECAKDYVFGARAGKARFRRLPEILRRLSPSSRDYAEFREALREIADQRGCSVHDLKCMAQWPAFKP